VPGCRSYLGPVSDPVVVLDHLVDGSLDLDLNPGALIRNEL
jgi:hypothetical protein